MLNFSQKKIAVIPLPSSDFLVVSIYSLATGVLPHDTVYTKSKRFAYYSGLHF